MSTASEPVVTAELAAVDQLRTPLLALLVFEPTEPLAGVAAEVDVLLGGALGRVLAAGDFGGRQEETLLLYPPAADVAIQRLLLVGAGKREQHSLGRLRRCVGAAVRAAERLGTGELDISLACLRDVPGDCDYADMVRTAAEAAVLAAWDFRELKSAREEGAPRRALSRIGLPAWDEDALAEHERAVRSGSITARAANYARDLQVRPGNVVTPTYLADRALQLGRELPLCVTVLDRAAIEREGMQALLAVARGSAEEPRFIVLEYRGDPAGTAPLVLVGKGVTFDSGGISIKPADRMEDMKYDMSGAAAVLGALRGIAELALPVNVVGVAPATENLPSGSAFKPGDVIGSQLGKTIEIVNTDAEGRLILADALSYVRRFRPAAVVDAATLTGACVIALGHHAIGLMGNDQRLVDQLRSAGARVGERCWQLPLWDEYRPQLDSHIADLKNAGGRPAGSITAGLFLQEFVDYPWAHLDIAGTAYLDEPAPYLRKGATGVPARLLIEWVRTRVEA